MSALAGWEIEALIASTLLMALVLLVRGQVRRVFGPQLGYALWLLPSLRLVLPPLPAVWRGAALPVGRASEAATILFVSAPPATAPAPGPVAWLGSGLALAWAVGAAGFLLYHVVAHARFCRRVLARSTPVERRGGIRVVTSAAAPGPLAFGIWRRYVAFPADAAERYDADERALALAHEIGHHQRGDLVANWAALTVLALHWFDPIAWRAFRAFRADQELANDARVLVGRSAGDRHVYACAIVKTAHGGAVSAACHLHTVTDLKGRLKMLSLSPASRRRLASGAAAVGVLVVAGLGLTASGSGAAAISAGVTQAVAPTVPAPPPPPVPPAASTASTGDTTGARKVKRVVVVKDGKTSSYEQADADAYIAAHPDLPIPPPVPGQSSMIMAMPGDPSSRIEVQDIPAVGSAKCGIGTGKPASMVVKTRKGEKRMIVICTDRIRQATIDAMVVAGKGRDIERDAYVRALVGLTGTRARIAADTNMSEADRARALTAIDTSITEMKGQVDHFN